MRQAAALARQALPAAYKPPRAATVYSWIRRGLYGVRLRALRVGRYWSIRPEDLAAFFAALAEATCAPASAPPAPAVPAPRNTEADRRRARDLGLL